MKVTVCPDRCKECSLCSLHCPKNAISHSHNTNLSGYHPIAIDDSKCISCGICYTMCPDGVICISG